MENHLRVVMAQINLLVGDIRGNLDRVLSAAFHARDRLQADLIIFPELTLTGYPPEDLLFRTGFLKQVEDSLEELRIRVHGIHLFVGHPQRMQGKLYNTASVLRDGQVLGNYYKNILPNYAVFDEKRYFAAGNKPLVVDVAGIAVGITICEDLWHYGPASATAKAGARLLVNLNASPYYIDKTAERETVLRERVLESGLPIVYVNLVGGQDELIFDGESLVMDASGEITQRALPFEEQLIFAEFVERDGRLIPLPGEQAPLLSLVANVYHALMLGVRDYIQKNFFPGVLVGLSGGVDSALTLAIAVDALGAEHVQAVMMPSRYSAAMSLEDACAEADTLGVRWNVLPIETTFQAFLATLADQFTGWPVDVTEENLQARCRGVLLMALSNKTGRLVLTTGNKSEMAVGYATLYGDMAGGFAVIKDVPKTLVYRLARYRNNIARIIPERVLTRPPSAELRPDQRDQDSLPPYEVLDPILEMYIEGQYCPEEIVAAGYDPATVQRIVTLVNRAEYKRRQAPLGIKITRCAFGRDRRYPITFGFGRSTSWNTPLADSIAHTVNYPALKGEVSRRH
ncbi:Glutamine-dependent NAD(+) synthetase [Gammaproteobacteria bacterium]